MSLYLSLLYFDILTVETYRLTDSPPKKSRHNASKVILDDHEDDFDIFDVDQSKSVERFFFSLLSALFRFFIVNSLDLQYLL